MQNISKNGVKIIHFMPISKRREWYYMEKPDEEAGTKKDLCWYRIQTAKEDLESAKILLKADQYKSSNNRSYYAVFHAVNAVHALSGKSFKRHKDAIGSFNKDYVKTEIFPREIGRKIGEWKRLGMPVIMTIFTLQVLKRQNGRF